MRMLASLLKGLGSVIRMYNCWDHIMTIELKVKKIGNSLGLILPKEATAKLNISEGDALFLTDGVNGGLRITAEDPNFGKQMKAAESIIKRYRNTFRELAK
jgi:putative addiction module antidote